MILTLDNLASRYHCLPSEVLGRGTTFDLFVLDVGAAWSNKKYDESTGNTTKKTKEVSAEEMYAAYHQSKGKQNA
jgi:hypothetical protein